MDLLLILFILVVLAVVFGGVFLHPLILLALIVLAVVAFAGRSRYV